MQRLPSFVHVVFVALAAALVAGAESGAAAEKTPVAVKEVVRLFDGKAMALVHTTLKDTKGEDPRKVFTVHDGMLHISGDGFGGVMTNEAYRDYHAVLEFKWGPRTWGERKDTAKDSGLMFHLTGPEDAFGGIWPEGFQAQMINGGTGDLFVVKQQGPVAVSLQSESENRGGKWYWKKGAPARQVTKGGVFWPDKDPDWKNVAKFRGKNDVESPDGEWTRLEVICEGDRVTIKVNGVLVNEASSLKPAGGKLLVQCEGAELFVRKWELWPLGKAPEMPPVRLVK